MASNNSLFKRRRTADQGKWKTDVGKGKGKEQRKEAVNSDAEIGSGDQRDKRLDGLWTKCSEQELRVDRGQDLFKY